jgi:CHAT domain-containing protein
LKSYLILSEVLEDADTDDEDPPDEKRLTAEDIFSCGLAKGALATLVGCRSGGADVSAADDVLGIPMALHYAGAAATVSSLWRLDDGDGAAWASAFYGDLHEQRRGGGSGPVARPEGARGSGEIVGDDGAAGVQRHGLVNLALAMRRAVRCLRLDADGQERAPYHWAGYVLSGCWKNAFGSMSSGSESS